MGFLLAAVFAAAVADAATVALRLTDKDGVIQDYYAHPDAFPVCKTQLDCITFCTGVDKLVRPNGQRLFNTKSAAIEVFRGAAKDRSFTGRETVDAIAAYETQGFEVKYVVVYREDWLVLNGPGGPWKQDIRILSAQELQNVRAALRASNLKSKNSVKVIQLLGAQKHGADSWLEIIKDPKLMAHLGNFDGVGVECHVGDFDGHRGKPLECMAMIAKWAKDRQKNAFVFMGGGPSTYTTSAATRSTYQYLWDQMARLGVDKKDAHLLYYRQGARAGVQLPENGETLTGQIKWLIEQVHP